MCRKNSVCVCLCSSSPPLVQHEKCDVFRPISLQNCSIKAIAKVLTNRLKPLIPLLVNQDQTGFLSGRSVSENFVYAADLLNCCHKRKAPTIVLKLDFRKAFDSVNSDALITILRHRGFPPKWCDWLLDILHTGKTAILLNGIPGTWINCKNGLRQGDPLSPYLFNTIADLLPQMIIHAFNAGLLDHPLCPDLPPVVLQCADDTLIMIKASTSAAHKLKIVLQDFASATGLTINYSKSTFVPIHLYPQTANNIAQILGTTTSSFPQTYLGLPLSTHKINSSDLTPPLL